MQLLPRHERGDAEHHRLVRLLDAHPCDPVGGLGQAHHRHATGSGKLQLANRLVLFPRQRQPELDPIGAGWRREPRLVGEPDRAWPDGVAADGVRPEGGGGEGGEHEGQ